MLQAGDDQDGGAKKRMQLDRSLLTALADRWRPEMHTFHLLCGKMAPTLHDVSYLIGLPSWPGCHATYLEGGALGAVCSSEPATFFGRT
jgi:hypothetical protein